MSNLSDVGLTIREEDKPAFLKHIGRQGVMITPPEDGQVQLTFQDKYPTAVKYLIPAPGGRYLPFQGYYDDNGDDGRSCMACDGIRTTEFETDDVELQRLGYTPGDGVDWKRIAELDGYAEIWDNAGHLLDGTGIPVKTEQPMALRRAIEVALLRLQDFHWHSQSAADEATRQMARIAKEAQLVIEEALRLKTIQNELADCIVTQVLVEERLGEEPVELSWSELSSLLKCPASVWKVDGILAFPRHVAAQPDMDQPERFEFLNVAPAGDDLNLLGCATATMQFQITRQAEIEVFEDTEPTIKLRRYERWIPPQLRP